MPEKKNEVRCVFSLQENAVNGEHLWLETNVSGDLCYLGEERVWVVPGWGGRAQSPMLG